MFKDRVVIITGAASGIGRALAEVLVLRGARVTATDIHDRLLKDLATAVAAKGKEIKVCVMDVTDREQVKHVVDRTVSECGRLDYIFNNAGIGVGGEARDFTYEDWKSVIDVNLYGIVNGVFAAYPVMVRQKSGHIVNTASLAGLVPFAGEISYTASKYGVVGLSHALRAEGADLGVKVSVICPGKIETPIYETSRIVNFDRDKVLAIWPRGITAEECAKVILNGVARNRATIVVTKLAWFLWTLQRLSPSMTIRIATRYIRKMRSARIAP
ncbi:MAG: SDR family oxidoreductase [Syntrophaceae bacterium]|nr:SDR family oxidoreductase [Syntrophaceae bacterium]